ncbi:hypothetical protein D3C76_1180520 [compost metagenome]
MDGYFSLLVLVIHKPLFDGGQRVGQLIFRNRRSDDHIRGLLTTVTATYKERQVPIVVVVMEQGTEPIGQEFLV